MKKLKNLLQSNLFLILLLIFTFFYISEVIKQEKITSNYNLESKKFSGYIKQISIIDNKITIYIEDLIITYYAKENDMAYKLQVGDYINVYGSISVPKKNTVPYLFNYKNFLYSKNIHYIVIATDIKLVNKDIPIFYKIKRNLISYIKKNSNFDYLMTFILGDNSYLSDEIKNSYNQNGVSHLFALSGMHVSILSTILFFFLGKILTKNKTSIIIIAFLIFYMFLTNFSKSIIRASIIMIFSLINKNYKLCFDIKKFYIIFTCIVLIINPFNIYNTGFLFSYIISFELILHSKIINNEKNYFKKVLIISFIAQLASLPIMINNYFQINILSCFINMLFVPLITFIIFPLSLLTLFFPLLNYPLTLSLNICEYLSLFLAEFKIFNIILCYINFSYILIYYLIINFILYKLKKGQKKYIILIIIVLIIHSNINILKDVNGITIIDVGQGDSILLNFANNNGTVLIDTGGKIQYENTKNTYSIVQSKIIPYLKSQGIKKIKYLVLTHGDYDHMGEAINLVENFKVEKVIFNCGEFNELEQDLIKVLEKKKIPYYSCIKKLNIDNNKLYFLNNIDYGNENDNSSVVYTKLNNHKFLFMGDAGVEVEEELLKKYNLQNIDILKVGHHGSRTSSSKNFIDEITPKYSIISVGENNKFGHPNKEVLENLNNSKIFRTDEHGSIMFKIKNDKLKIETCSP